MSDQDYNEEIIVNCMQNQETSESYLASNAKAIAPDATGVAALVPSKPVVHSPKVVVVALNTKTKHVIRLGVYTATLN